MAAKDRESKKKKILKKVVLTSLFTIFLSAAGIICYVNKQLNNVKVNPLPNVNEELGINLKASENISSKVGAKERNIKQRENMEDITSIAFFGIDSRKVKSDIPHSDCIIVTTIDKKRNKIKISSIMRDTYVDVRGHGKTKITEAYFYGGPKLAVRTLNENFNLNIRDYVTVDFKGLTKIIDDLGGITVNVKKYEFNEINKWIKELSEIENTEYLPIYKEGVQELNGLQAVAYCRIRRVGDGDFERTDRQRYVLTEIINKIKKLEITKYPSIVSKFLLLVETSLSKTDIITLGSKVITSNISNIEQQRFPVDGYCKGELINGIWYLVSKPDLTVLSTQIYEFIFNDIKPMPKPPLF
ncbi:LCP family protein [Clostridium sp. DJ247]|uniref:LCP family protein n=1 Tax=Clostridium sp. DJ247 TaxID=2726188 RepID=UPI0016240F0B|nr:LCP family protein [Clostridium sp. DJ247]MBC2582462.1 LCP family protein [Clostridium sp. DJ247]